MLTIKAFHIILVVSWFAGLFYLPRIYVNLAAITDAQSAEYQRLLGMSRILTCNTNVLISVTGNNLSFGADEQSRFLPVHLLAHDDNYRLDVVNHYLSVRDQVLRDIIGVIAGYLQ